MARNELIQKWMFPEIVGFPPKSSILIRVFQYIFTIHFGGFPPIFELTPNGFLGILDVGALSDRSCQLHVQGLMPIPVRGCPVTSELRLKFVTSNSWQNAARVFLLVYFVAWLETDLYVIKLWIFSGFAVDMFFLQNSYTNRSTVETVFFCSSCFWCYWGASGQFGGRGCWMARGFLG